MITNNQKVLDAIVEQCKVRKASAFTERFVVDGIEYAYMSEVDPHCDEPVDEENVWHINFVAVKPGYFFMYHFEGQQFCVEPEVGKTYSFNFTELHALLKKKNVKHFENQEIWDLTLSPDTKLACIFTLGHK